MIVQLKRLFDAAIVPQRGSDLASGFDLHAFDVVKPEHRKDPVDETFRLYIVQPGERVFIRTGIAVAMPAGMEAQVRPRSGLSLNEGIYVSLGTIDADYRGDIGITFTNNGDKPFHIFRGDRVAQLVFAPVLHDVKLEELENLNDTERGNGGFGHTGRGSL